MKLRPLALAALLGLSSVALAQNTPPNYTAMWWNPAESGWGLNIAHQGDVLFPMWFTYGTNGQLQWYAVSGAAKQPDGSYTGEVFRFTGKPFNQITGAQAFNQSTPVGTASLRFGASNALSFSYTIEGITQTKNLSRFAFSAAPEPVCTFTGGSRSSATNYTDIWWNQAESGWGLTLAHQGDDIFGLWYTYGSTGAAQWVSAFGSKQPDGSFKGDLNRATSGTGFNQINGTSATSFPLPKVGEFELRFSNGETGTFKYKLDGIEQTKQISRFVFGAPVSVCAAATSNPNPGGNANSDCFRPFIAGDVSRFRNTSVVTGAPIPIPPTVTTYSERIKDGTYNGEAVKVQESLTAEGQVQSRAYYRNVAQGTEFIAQESLEPATGAIKGVTRFSPALIFPNSMEIGQTVSYNATATITDTALGTLTRNVVQTYKLVGRETVTVPAGTYANACKIETQETVTAPEGSSTSVSQVWSLGSVGDIKVTFKAFVAGFNVDTTIELTNFTPGN